jgi:hypothetical protein
MENANEPINPCKIQGKQGFGDRPTIPNREVYGLTKREYFAGIAMQGYCGGEFTGQSGMSGESIAKWSVAMADALLEELENKKK